MKHLLLLGIAVATLHFSHAVLQDFCIMKPDKGDGELFKYFLHYDAEEDRCIPFVYSGEGGNPNRFENERECIRNCSDNAEKLYPMQASHACKLDKMDGVCGGKYLRFYFDDVHLKCKKFFWSGCGGNGNRFVTHSICNTTCTGVKSRSGSSNTEQDGDEPDTPVAIICGTLIGVILAAMLISTIVLFLKSRKMKVQITKGKNRDKTEDPLKDQGIEME